MHPAGEIHALAPRPRPAICFDAKDTIGAGSARRNFGFLKMSGSDTVNVQSSTHFSSMLCVLVTTSPYRSAFPILQVLARLLSSLSRNSFRAEKNTEEEKSGV